MGKKKIMLSVGVVAIAAIFFLSCNFCKNVVLLTKGNVKEKSFMTSVDFELRKGLVIVKARVNNYQEEMEFIFDTGAFDNKISANAAKALNLKAITSKDKSDSHGNVRSIDMTVINELKIGGVTFRNTAAGILNYPKNSASECIAKDGIIGANLIRECNWKIDYINKKIWMTDDVNNFKELKGKSGIEFKHPLLSGTPKMKIGFENRELGNILLDVGSNGGIDFPKSILNHLKDYSENRSFKTTIDNASSGIWGGRLDTVLTSKANIKLGTNLFEKRNVNFKSHGFAKIGNEVLSKFDVYLNYDDDEVFLIPNKNHNKPENEREFGFVPYHFSKSQWVIRSIQEGGIAHLAGLSLGDTISSINNQLPSDYYKDYCGFVFWVGDFLDQNDSLYIETKNKKVKLLKEKISL